MAFYGGGTVLSFTNGNASPITRGQAVYLTAAADTVDLATAASDAAAARAVALVKEQSIASGSAGSFAGPGEKALARLEPGLVLGNGDELYLSATTPGSLTTVAPSAAGQVIQTMGWISDASAYDGAGNLLATIMFVLGPKAVA